ncbi:MAG: hypothetical protein FGM26_13100, partial [Beijerinckiaceae bacterium]|nr:hypothetical protein [Beijerinckiaceae bacterium]
EVIRAKGNTIEQLFANKQGNKTTLPVIIKGDVHGSVEAIVGSLRKITEDNPELAINVLHSGVGGITESDVTLATGSNAMVIGFNVRANAQARDLSQKNGINMRYYSIIYNVIDDVKALMSGMLSPTLREEFIGTAIARFVLRSTRDAFYGLFAAQDDDFRRLPDRDGGLTWIVSFTPHFMACACMLITSVRSSRACRTRTRSASVAIFSAISPQPMSKATVCPIASFQRAARMRWIYRSASSCQQITRLTLLLMGLASSSARTLTTNLF